LGTLNINKLKKKLLYIVFIAIYHISKSQCTIINSNDVDYCGLNNIQLQASVPSGNCSFIWYNQQVNGTILHRGCNYPINNINCEEFNYYVEDTASYLGENVIAGYSRSDVTLGADQSGRWEGNYFRTFFTTTKLMRFNSVRLHFDRRNFDCNGNRITVRVIEENGTSHSFPVYVPCGNGIENSSVNMNLDIPPGNHEIRIEGAINLIRYYNNNPNVNYSSTGPLYYNEGLHITGNAQANNIYGGIFDWDVTFKNPCPRARVRVYSSCPTIEICNNGIDDDCDGLIDCDDPDCGNFGNCDNYNYTNVHQTNSILICKGDNIIIRGNSLNNGVWRGENMTVLNDSTIRAYPSTTTTYYYYQDDGYIRGDNLVVNGDFENGNVGFNSNYTPSCLRDLGEGRYCVNNNPRNVHTGFANCTDHTSNNGNMLVANGGPVLNQKIWCQNIVTEPNTIYEFSAWMTAVVGLRLPIFQFQVNNQLIGGTLNITKSNCAWENYNSLWNSGLTTNAEICIVNRNNAAGGNDFAIDDITFYKQIPVRTQSDSITVVVENCVNTCEVSLNKAPINVCLNDSVNLNSLIISSPGNGIWRIDSFPSPLSASINNHNLINYFSTNSNTNTGTYKLILESNFNNEICKDSLYINVYSNPIVNLGEDRTICQNDPNEIFDAGIFSSYDWYMDANGNNPTFESNLAGEYAVRVTDVNGCQAKDTVILNVNFCPINLINPDTLRICLGDSTNIQAKFLQNASWTGSNFRMVNDSTIWAKPTQNTWYYYGASGGYARGANMIINGDFENGMQNFTSEYQADCNPPIYPRQYCVDNNPNRYYGGFSNCGDHSTGNGNMMIVDGTTIAGQEVWCQNVPVTPSTDYEFSAWITSIFAPNPAILLFEINGNLIGSPLNANVNTCDWENYAATWNSGLNVNARICLLNNNIQANGNDFALDDIEFVPIQYLPNQMDSVFVIVNNNPIVNLGPDVTICQNDSIELNAGNFMSYQWYINGSGNQQFENAKIRGKYAVRVTDINGCEGKDTIELSLQTCLDNLIS
jgi:hypothetical protein